MTWKEARDALSARFATAFAAAQGVDATFVLDPARRNRQDFIPAPDVPYLRCYWKPVRTERRGLSPGFDRAHRMVFVQIMVPGETGDEVVVDVADAIGPSFETNGDGLEFEESAGLEDGRRHGSHFVAEWSIPFFFDRLRTS